MGMIKANKDFTELVNALDSLEKSGFFWDGQVSWDYVVGNHPFKISIVLESRESLVNICKKNLSVIMTTIPPTRAIEEINDIGLMIINSNIESIIGSRKINFTVVASDKFNINDLQEMKYKLEKKYRKK